MYPTMTLALLAHAGRQEALAEFVLDHRPALAQFHLLAPADTGTWLQRRTHLAVAALAGPGPQPGLSLTQLAGQHEVQAVIFFRDPLAAGPPDPDFAELLSVCDCQEIPLATNVATAEALLYFLRCSPNRGIVAARTWGRVAPPPATVPAGRSSISSDLQSL